MAIPPSIIQEYSAQPEHIVPHLTQSFTTKQLVAFRDPQYNNLIHITAKALLEQQHSPQFPILLEQYKPVFSHLRNIGIRVNELNDDWQAPIFYIYQAADTRRDTALEPLVTFFEHDLQAHPTYFSLEPALRPVTHILLSALRCCRRAPHED